MLETTHGEEQRTATSPSPARIAIYQTKPGTVDSVIERARDELVTQVRQSPGFRRYTTLRTGPDAIVSITGWVREALGPSLASAQNHLGETAFLDEASANAPGYGRVAIFQL